MKKNKRKKFNHLISNGSNKLFYFKTMEKKKHIYSTKKLIFVFVIIIILFLVKILFLNRRNKNIISKELIFPKITKNTTNINTISTLKPSELRESFRNIIENRKKYEYDNSYLPYIKIDKSLSYKENGEKIFESTGMLNFTMLDYYYNNSK